MRTSVSGIVALAGAAFLLGGCGDDAVPESGAAPQIRIVDLDGRAGACDDGEEILNAYCYVKPEGSISASSVVFMSDADGSMTAECLSGGRNIRLFCLKR